MSDIKITIDGEKFSDMDEFYDEMERLLTKGLSWRTGHNLNAFHDLLRGGFGVHEYGETVDFRWINAKKSREDFGYAATAAYWEKVLEKCHPANRDRVREKIAAAQRGEGKTLFDMITDDIMCEDSVYRHTLTIED